MFNVCLKIAWNSLLEINSFLKQNFIFLIFQKSNFGIDLDGSNFDVTSISAEISTFNGGAKEVESFNCEIQYGPEGSRG